MLTTNIHARTNGPLVARISEPGCPGMFSAPNGPIRRLGPPQSGTTLAINRLQSAFTLIEVLMGVLILSLALLGMAAVFPVVAREQRLARESVAGNSAANSVDSYIRSSSMFSQPADVDANGMVQTRYGWDLLLGDDSTIKTDWSKETKVTGKIIVNGAEISTPRYYTDWEGMRFAANGTATFPAAGNIQIPVNQRIWPQRVNAEDTPLLVWDMVARRATGGNEATRDDDDRVQAVIFVRRIDASIRVPNGSTLWDALTSGVAIPISSYTDSGAPSLSGERSSRPPLQDYSQVCVVSASKGRIPIAVRKGDAPTILKLERSNNTGGKPWQQREIRGSTGEADYKDAVALAMQVGQKLVDPFGTVYTVVDVGNIKDTFDKADSAADDYRLKSGEILITPGLTPEALQAFAETPGRLDFIFTPQVPVEVLVREYSRGN